MEGLRNLLENVLGARVAALVMKELSQITRDKQQLFFLLFPPIVQICLYGCALSPDVTDLRMGIADECKTYKSRELISAVVENQVFQVAKTVGDTPALMKEIEHGLVDAGLVIPPNFDRLISQHKRSPVQLILDGVDANTAGIAQGYATQISDHLHLQSRTHNIVVFRARCDGVGAWTGRIARLIGQFG
jgi:ABC-2 type transport system permease protein